MTKVLKEKDASKWSATGNEMVKCPVPGCNHLGLLITKIHCRMEHDMERHEIEEKYGHPKRVVAKGLTGSKQTIPSYAKLKRVDY